MVRIIKLKGKINELNEHEPFVVQFPTIVMFHLYVFWVRSRVAESTGFLRVDDVAPGTYSF